MDSFSNMHKCFYDEWNDLTMLPNISQLFVKYFLSQVDTKKSRVNIMLEFKQKHFFQRWDAVFILGSFDFVIGSGNLDTLPLVENLSLQVIGSTFMAYVG